MITTESSSPIIIEIAVAASNIKIGGKVRYCKDNCRGTFFLLQFRYNLNLNVFLLSHSQLNHQFGFAKFSELYLLIVYTYETCLIQSI